LLSQVPAGKISFNKKIVSYEQDKDGVTIHTSDNETFHGDILVGADGTYSTIRKIMLERLVKTSQLPLSDRQGLRATHACVIGTTKPLDPEKYPLLKDKSAYFSNVVGHAKAHSVRSLFFFFFSCCIFAFFFFFFFRNDFLTMIFCSRLAGRDNSGCS